MSHRSGSSGSIPRRVVKKDQTYAVVKLPGDEVLRSSLPLAEARAYAQTWNTINAHAGCDERAFLIREHRVIRLVGEPIEA